MSGTPFEMPLTAGPDDIDELGHVNNAVWVQWIQRVAVAHWAAHADPADVARYYWVVTRHEIDYRGNIAAGETVTARTWIATPPRGARFARNVAFLRGERPVVEAVSEWAMIDRETGRIARVPAHIAARFLG
jgi:acyl-CoA thioester hydrolase